MNSRCTFLMVVMCMALTGCYSRTGAISREPISYFQLSNASGDLTAILDEAAPVALHPVKGTATLKVAPGKHRIRVIRGSVAVVDRIVLVSDLQTLEIAVP